MQSLLSAIFTFQYVSILISPYTLEEFISIDLHSNMFLF